MDEKAVDDDDGKVTAITGSDCGTSASPVVVAPEALVLVEPARDLRPPSPSPFEASPDSRRSLSSAAKAEAADVDDDGD
jgi:hypothetical protein